MKKFLFILLTFFTLTSCGSGNQTKKNAEQNVADVKQNDCVEVLYFHGKKRCITCNAIENLTKSLIEKDFAEQLKNGEIIFKIIDISDAANKEIAEKYEITWSSLLINKQVNGQEVINNMTEFGFANAKNSPDVFQDGVKKKLEELLK